MTKATDPDSVRHRLRRATAQDHERVDELFSRFSLESQADYTAFLQAHARAVGALEPAAAPMHPRLSLLADDLAALDAPMPSPLPLEDKGGEGFRWGLLYALEGSRLGGAMLARRVAPDLPRAYLSAVHEKGGWAAFQQALDAAAAEGGAAWVEDAARGAAAAFALFAQAAAA